MNNTTREILLSSKKHPRLIAIVDEEDYEFINNHTWFPKEGQNTFYAVANQAMVLGKRPSTMFRMHRLIFRLNKNNLQIDHINGNGLDNRKCNLRLATHQQNHQNMQSPSNSVSKYKGVHWDKANKKWVANINPNRECIYLGRFTNGKEAALAYDKAALGHYGEFARLNLLSTTGV